MEVHTGVRVSGNGAAMTHSDEQRRRQILEAAARLLRHYGPGKTTMAEIAREARVGVGSVYLEFPSKDAIVEALSVMRHNALLAAMRDAAATGGPTGAARLCAVLDAKVICEQLREQVQNVE